MDIILLTCLLLCIYINIYIYIYDIGSASCDNIIINFKRQYSLPLRLPWWDEICSELNRIRF
jgi:hypothetical protein